MTKARARVQVTLEIDVTGGDWGPSAKVEQIFSQAKRESMQDLEQLLKAAREGGIPDSSDMRRRLYAKVVGEPKVTAVLVEEGS